MIHDLVDRLGLKEPVDLKTWEEVRCVPVSAASDQRLNPLPVIDLHQGDVRRLVNEFVDIRFPTIFVLNKVRVVVCSSCHHESWAVVGAGGGGVAGVA